MMRQFISDWSSTRRSLTSFAPLRQEDAASPDCLVSGFAGALWLPDKDSITPNYSSGEAVPHTHKEGFPRPRPRPIRGGKRRQRLGRPARVRDSSKKLVAKPHYSLNELRIPRISLQLLSQSEDVDIHGSRRRHSNVPPHFLQKLLSRQRCSPMLDEVFDQLKLPRRESHW
jgi:hypothetical protein